MLPLLQFQLSGLPTKQQIVIELFNYKKGPDVN
jgi:hypothetical protein